MEWFAAALDYKMSHEYLVNLCDMTWSSKLVDVSQCKMTQNCTFTGEKIIWINIWLQAVIHFFLSNLIGLNQPRGKTCPVSRALLFVILPKKLLFNCSNCRHLGSQEKFSPQLEDYQNRKYKLNYSCLNSLMTIDSLVGTNCCAAKYYYHYSLFYH